MRLPTVFSLWCRGTTTVLDDDYRCKHNNNNAVDGRQSCFFPSSLPVGGGFVVQYQ